MLVLFLIFSLSNQAQVRVNIKGNTPQPIFHNAVCEGYLEDMPFIFSFGGKTELIDQAADNFRYNALTGEINLLPPFPDGYPVYKAKACLVGDIVFVLTGTRGDSINQMVYRYDQKKHVFLSDGEAIPTPVTQNGLAKYRDSLIFIVGGQTAKGATNKVQVYNPVFDHWRSASPLPKMVNEFKEAHFSAVFVQDTLNVLAQLDNGDGIRQHLFTAVLDGQNLNELQWMNQPLQDSMVLMPPIIATSVRNEAHWMGIAREQAVEDGAHFIDFTLQDKGSLANLYKLENIPGFINSIARISDTIQFLCGGLYPGGEISNEVIMLTWTNLGHGVVEKIKSDRRFYLYPNPCQGKLRIQSVRRDLEALGIEVFDMQGKKLLNKKIRDPNERISLESFADRAFIVRIFDNEGNYYVDKILKTY